MAATIDAPAYTLQIALNTGATPTWTTIPNVRAFGSQRGRQDELGTVEPGQCTVRVSNSDGSLSPENTGSAYYPNLKVGRRLRLTATYNAVTYYLFFGYIQSITPLDNTAVDSDVTIVAIDFFKLLTQQKVSATLAAQDVGTRIDAILTLVGTPGLTRSLETADMTMLGGVLSRVAALQHINDILAAERGVFFVAGDGTLTYHARHHRYFAARSVTVQATYNQDQSGGGLPYQTLEYVYDDQLLNNEIAITPTQTGEGEQVAFDSTSEAAYGTRTLALSTDWLGSGYALGLAQWILAGYKDPRPRVPSITFDADANPASLYPALLGAELGDRIQVVRNNPGTLAISKQLWIENIALAYDVAGTSGLIATFLLSDPAAYGATTFRLDLSTLGGPDGLDI